MQPTDDLPAERHNMVNVVCHARYLRPHRGHRVGFLYEELVEPGHCPRWRCSQFAGLPRARDSVHKRLVFRLPLLCVLAVTRPVAITPFAALDVPLRLHFRLGAMCPLPFAPLVSVALVVRGAIRPFCVRICLTPGRRVRDRFVTILRVPPLLACRSTRLAVMRVSRKRAFWMSPFPMEVRKGLLQLAARTELHALRQTPADPG